MLLTFSTVLFYAPTSSVTLPVRSGFPPKPLSDDEESPLSYVLSPCLWAPRPVDDVLGPKCTVGHCRTRFQASSNPSSSILSNGKLFIGEVPDDNSSVLGSVGLAFGGASSFLGFDVPQFKVHNTMVLEHGRKVV
ncbi:unnamed protein product [Agarophyton chilense]